MRRARTFVTLTAIVLAGAPLSAQRSSTDSLLSRLTGHWVMRGSVRGRTETYTMDGERVLAGKFVALHMVDTTHPPAYEARVFMGADTAAGRIIVHWLDAFGAAYSVPAATGMIRGDTLDFTFQYSTGPFRDLFIYRPASRSWYFRLEDSDSAGHPRLFGEYTVTRD